MRALHHRVIKNQSAVWICSVLPALKRVQHLLCPLADLRLRRTQFEHCAAILVIRRVAASEAPAELGCAVQISFLVEDQVALRKVSVLATLEAVDHALCPGRFTRWQDRVSKKLVSYAILAISSTEPVLAVR